MLLTWRFACGVICNSWCTSGGFSLKHYWQIFGLIRCSLPQNLLKSSSNTLYSLLDSGVLYCLVLCYYRNMSVENIWHSVCNNIDNVTNYNVANYAFYNHVNLFSTNVSVVEESPLINCVLWILSPHNIILLFESLSFVNTDIPFDSILMLLWNATNTCIFINS